MYTSLTYNQKIKNKLILLLNFKNPKQTRTLTKQDLSYTNFTNFL